MIPMQRIRHKRRSDEDHCTMIYAVISDVHGNYFDHNRDLDDWRRFGEVLDL